MRQYPYQKISRQIEQYIEDNGITGRMPGILKLSRELRVNHVTLSRAIHDLAQKGIVAIDGTKGTFVTPKERIRPRQYTIGIVGLDERSPGSSRLLTEFNNTAEPYGYHMIGLLHQPELFEQNVEMLGLFPVDGFIFIYSSLTVSIAEYLRGENIPFVTCNFHPGVSGVDMCDYDSRTAYSDALKMLVARGHRRVAFLTTEKGGEYRWFSEMIREIWQENLKEDFDEKLILASRSIFEYVRKYPSDFYRRFAVDNAEYLLNMRDPVTGVIGAFSVMDEFRKYLVEAGIPVPGRMSLIGFSANWCGEISALDSWNGNVEHLCKWALSRLLERLNGKKPEQETRLFPLVYHRMGTVGTAPQANRITGKQ